ncbi:MAG: asparagine synthase-related protein [Planctomycetes bacterium]|nr:asparagine synthase-related protein [Planctomycetota bacterium]
MGAVFAVTRRIDRETLDRVSKRLSHRGREVAGSVLSDDFCAVYRGNETIRGEPAYPHLHKASRFVIVLDGFIKLARPLVDVSFRSRNPALDQKDVIVRAYLREGIDFLSHLRGSFSLLLYDRELRTLIVARDPVGTKSIVYAESDGIFACASEAKALFELPWLKNRKLDASGIHLATHLRYIPAPFTCFHGVKKLEPGTALVVRRGEIRKIGYYVPDDTPQVGCTDLQANEATLSRLRSSIISIGSILRGRKFGIALSGGISSTAIVEQMRRHFPDEISTYSAIVDHCPDEAAGARQTAKYYGTRHHECIEKASPFESLSSWLYYLEEPRFSLLPYSALAKNLAPGTSNIILGAGADEVLVGHEIYRLLLPSLGWQMLFSKRLSQVFLGPFADLLCRGSEVIFPSPLADLGRQGIEITLSTGDPTRYYGLWRGALDFRKRISNRIFTREFSKEVEATTRDVFQPFFERDGRDVLENALFAEFRTRLPEHTLLALERIFGAVGVTPEYPYLDENFFEYFFSVPFKIKMKLGDLKHVLKAAMKEILPDNTLEKRKEHLAYNVYDLVSAGLLQAAEKYLSKDALAATGIYRHKYVKKILDTEPDEILTWHYNLLSTMICVQSIALMFAGSEMPAISWEDRPTSFRRLHLANYVDSEP